MEITTGPDGALWFTNNRTARSGGSPPTGWSAPTRPRHREPGAIVAGPDGALWFTDAGSYTIDRITTDGIVTSYTDPSVDFPDGITVGPDHALWFTNAAGNSIGRLTIVDATPPIVSLPDLVVVDATGPQGAVVAYVAGATDDVDPSPHVSCTPPSGGVFTIGDTTVICTARDFDGNTATGSFTVHVNGAPEQLADLVADLEGVGPGRVLTLTASRAQSLLAAGRVRSTCLLLGAFTAEVKALSRTSISTSQASVLIARAARIMSVLGCEER